MKNPLTTAFVPGREAIGRWEYLIFTTFATGVLVVVAIVAMVVLSMVLAGTYGAARAEGMLQATVPALTVLVLLPASIHTGIVLGVRRLHDIGRSGWLMAPAYVGYAIGLGGAMFPKDAVPLLGYVQAAGTTTFLASLVALLLVPGKASDASAPTTSRRKGK